MNGSWWKRIAALLGIALITWIGYSTWVMHLQEFVDDTRAVLQVADRAAAGSSTTVRVLVTDRDTGEPRAEKPVILLMGVEVLDPVAEGITDAQGVFVAEVDVPDELDEVELTARVGSGISEQSPSAKFRVERAHSLVLDTDKPRYQPGQDIQIRAMARETGGTPVQDDVAIRVENPEGTVFYDRQIEANDFGMLQTVFPLSEVAPEGRYRLVASYGDAERVTTVEVERYTLPQFEVQIDSSKRYYRPGDTVDLEISADYFFGKPVADGKFELVGARYVDEMEPFDRIEGRLDEDGGARVEVELPDYFVGAPGQGGLGLATMEVEVTDGAGDRESTIQDLRVTHQELLIDAFPAGGGLVKGVENRVWMTARTPDGRPVAATVELEFASGAARQEVETNSSGLGSFRFLSESVFQQEITATAVAEQPMGEDAADGDPLRASTTLEFGAEETRDLVVVVERPSYRVGDTLAAEILSSTAQGPVYVDVIGHGETHFTQTLVVDDHRASLDFEISSSMAGQLQIRVWFLGFEGEVHQTGTIVPVVDAQDLSLRVRPDAEQYKPGESARIQLETREGGEAVPASVGLDIVDESVFAIGSNELGMAAAHFHVERELLQPKAWLYQYSPADLLQPDPETVDYMPHCGMKYAELDSASNHSDGWRDLVDRIEERQLEQATWNAWIALFFLMVISLALVVWIVDHQRDGDVLENLAPSALALVLIAVVAPLGLWLTMALASGIGDDLVALIIFALSAGTLIATAILRADDSDGTFWMGLAALVSLHIVLVYSAFELFEDHFDVQLLFEYGYVFAGAGLVVPFAMAYIAGEYLKERQFTQALAPIAVGVTYMTASAFIAYHEEWLFNVIYAMLALGAIGWAFVHRYHDIEFVQRVVDFFAGAFVTFFITIFSIVGVNVSAKFLESFVSEKTFVIIAVSLFVIAALWAGKTMVRRDQDWSIFGLCVGYSLFVATVAVDLIHFQVSSTSPLILAMASAIVAAILIYLVGKLLRQSTYDAALGLSIAASLLAAPLVIVVLVFTTGFDAHHEGLDTIEMMIEDEVYRDEVSLISVDRFGGGEEFEEVHAPAELAGSADLADPGDPAADEDEIAVRDFFPETLFSDIVITGDDGTAVVDLQMADSITNWKIDAAAVSALGSMGTASADAIVFQPFFIEPQLPVSLTQGDTVVVVVSVFNYSGEILDMTMELEGDDWFDADTRRRRLQLPPNRVDSMEFEITASENGVHEIQWTAQATGADSGDSIGDAVRRSVEVEPHGRQHTEVASGTLDGPTKLILEVPEHAVEGSPRAVLELHPGVLGQMVEGMDALLSMPTGCFEQTASSLYPSAMALAYMEQMDILNPEIQMRAERYIAQGYQQILSFDQGQGGYALFRHSAPTASVTAHGLRMLVDVDEVYSVDSIALKSMFDYVGDQQNTDGSWDVDPNASYAVGVTEKLSLTAFIAWSLSTYDSDANSVSKGIEYIISELEISSASTRDLAQVLILLAAVNEHSDLQQQIGTELQDRAEHDSGVVKWPFGFADGVRSGGRTTMENTAFVTLALLNSRQAEDLADGGLAFLAESKNVLGWGTTQATTVALAALMAATDVEETIDEGSISAIRDDEEVWSLELDGQTGGEAHMTHFEIPSGTTTVELDAPEDSGFQFRLETRYHEPWEDSALDEEDLVMEVEYDRTELRVDERVEVTAALEVRDESVGMAIVDVGIPPGFAADRATLDEAVERREIGDFEVSARQVILYFENIDARVGTAFEIIAQQPIEASSGSSSAYDYYAPERKAHRGPVDFVVR